MLLRKIIFFVFILVVISYAIFTSRGVLFSPRLDVFAPKNGEHIVGTNVHFSGKTIPKTQIWVDGARVESDESGFFGGAMTFHPGYNEMGFSVKNRFGRESRKVLQFVVE